MDVSLFRKPFFLIVLAVLIAAAAWLLFRLGSGQSGSTGTETPAVAVAVADIIHGPITLRRTFSGSLEARAEFLVAPKVSGRVERLPVDIADIVSRGQMVAELDNDEYVQEKERARADLAVARANRVEAENALIIANREMERVRTLNERGIKSESQLDAAKTAQLEKEAALEVARAQVIRAEAALETANIRLGYTTVTAEWSGDDDQRVVAERFVDEGDTVSATTALMSIVALDPIIGVIHITEKDYSRLAVGQAADLTTDAFPVERFEARISRIAPVFRQETRQARVELLVDNPRHRLKPGMFIRATVVLDHVEAAIIVPEQALTKRGGQTGVFVVAAEEPVARWRPVTIGIREDERVQVDGPGLAGYVVILGQALLDDGSAVIVADRSEPNPAGEGVIPSSDQEAASL